MSSSPLLRFAFCLLSVACSLLPVPCFPQDSLYKHEIEISGDYYFNSDAFTNEFFSAFYNGDFIDKGLKDRVDKRLTYINRWGFDLKTEINWRYSPAKLFGKKGLSCNASIKDRLHGDGIFSQDFYRVALYGNKMFAGEHADLGNFKLNFLGYQQLQFGIEWNLDSVKNNYGIAISLLKGERNFTVDVKRGDLYTADDGSYIDMDFAIRSKQSDTSQTGPLAFNGFGLSTDMFYEIPYVTWYNDGVLSIQLQDLGFIQWNSRSMDHRLDTFIHYEGLVVNDIFDLQSGTFPETDPDTIINNNLKYRVEAYTTFLPAIFSISATTYYGKKFLVEKGINYRFLANARPYYYGTFMWNTCKALTLGWNVSYGGYGRFNAGMEAELRFARRFTVNVNSFYLAGILVPSKLGGLGANLSLSGKF